MGEKPKMRVICAKILLLSKIKFYLTNCCSGNLLITTIAIGMPKNFNAGFSSDFEQFFLGKKQLCVFLRNKYGFQIWNAMEKNKLFWPGRNVQNGLILHICRFLDRPIPVVQVWDYFQVFPSYGLYALSWKHLTIGFLEYFAAFLKILHLKEIARKCTIFFHQLYFFFLWEGQACFFEQRPNFIWEGQKEGVRGSMGEKPKMRVTFAKIPLLSKIQIYLTNCCSGNLLITTIAIGMPKNFNAGIFKWFWEVLPGVFLRNKYGFQIWNAMEKNKLFWPGRNVQNGLILHICRFLDRPIPMAQVLRLLWDVSKLWTICIILETSHNRIFGIFCSITQNTTPEGNSQRMFHISSSIVLFFLWEGQGCFWTRIKFHLGRAKGRGKRQYGGEAQNEGYFCMHYFGNCSS